MIGCLYFLLSGISQLLYSEATKTYQKIYIKVSYEKLSVISPHKVEIQRRLIM